MTTAISNDVKVRVSTYLKENREKLVSNLQKLIQIPSESGYEGPVQEHIRKKMIELGLDVDTFEADDSVRNHPEYTESVVEREVGFKGRPNVVGKWTGSGGKGKSLLHVYSRRHCSRRRSCSLELSTTSGRN